MKNQNVKTSTGKGNDNSTAATNNDNFVAIGTLRYTDTTKLIEEYRKQKSDEVLNVLLQKVMKEKLEEFEYVELYDVKNKALRSAVLLKAPIQVMKNIVLSDANFNLCEILTKRMEKEPFDVEFSKKACKEVRYWAANYQNDEQILKNIVTECDPFVARKLWNNIKKKEFNNAQIEKLLDAYSSTTRMSAVVYSPKYILVNKLLGEYSSEVSDKILRFLQDYKIPREIANKLLVSSIASEKVKKAAAKYATKTALVNALCKEKDRDVIAAIMEKLENFKITSTQAASILKQSHSTRARIYAVQFASYKILLDTLEKEFEADVVEKILERLENYDFSKCNVQRFLYAQNKFTEAFFVKYATKEQLLKRLQCMTSEVLEERILETLVESGNLTEEEANRIVDVDANSVILCNDLLKCVSEERRVQVLLRIDDEGVIKAFFELQQDKKLSQKTANELLDASSFKVREYAVQFASYDKVAESLLEERTESVIIKMLEVLEKQNS